MDGFFLHKMAEDDFQPKLVEMTGNQFCQNMELKSKFHEEQLCLKTKLDFIENIGKKMYKM